MAGECKKSPFTGTHVWAITKERPGGDKKQPLVEVIRCAFCRVQAPPDEAQKAIDARDYAKRTKEMTTPIPTDSQLTFAAAKAKKGKAS